VKASKKKEVKSKKAESPILIQLFYFLSFTFSPPADAGRTDSQTP